MLADGSANACICCRRSPSQAEHGKDSQVVLVAFSESMVEQVQDQIEEQLAQLPRKDIAKEALNNSLAIVLHSYENAMDFVNEYAPEHLILNATNADELASLVRNTGSVFIGAWSPESVGDYASGTNHTLPTNGFAKAYSGVSLESFQKYITFQSLTREGLKNLGPIGQNDGRSRRSHRSQAIDQHKIKRTLMMKIEEVLSLVRPHLLDLRAYSTRGGGGGGGGGARDEFDQSNIGASRFVFLDANENPFETEYNRYPDPHQRDSQEKDLFYQTNSS